MMTSGPTRPVQRGRHVALWLATDPGARARDAGHRGRREPLHDGCRRHLPGPGEADMEPGTARRLVESAHPEHQRPRHPAYRLQPRACAHRQPAPAPRACRRDGRAAGGHGRDRQGAPRSQRGGPGGRDHHHHVPRELPPGHGRPRLPVLEAAPDHERDALDPVGQPGDEVPGAEPRRSVRDGRELQGGRDAGLGRGGQLGDERSADQGGWAEANVCGPQRAGLQLHRRSRLSAAHGHVAGWQDQHPRLHPDPRRQPRS